jgi:hypothetical protein
MSHLLKRFFRIVLTAIMPIGIFLWFISYSVAAILSEREKTKSEQEEYEQSKTNEIKEEKIYEQNKTNEINNLVSKYNLKYNWDTLSYEFSLEYKPIINSSYQLATDVWVQDIFDKDGVVYALLKINGYYSFYIEFPISKEQENKLIGYNNNRAFNACLLVVNITSIQKIKYELKALAHASDEDASLFIGDSEDFFGKGTIVDIVLISEKK